MLFLHFRWHFTCLHLQYFPISIAALGSHAHGILSEKGNPVQKWLGEGATSLWTQRAQKLLALVRNGGLHRCKRRFGCAKDSWETLNLLPGSKRQKTFCALGWPLFEIFRFRAISQVHGFPTADVQREFLLAPFLALTLATKAWQRKCKTPRLLNAKDLNASLGPEGSL